MISPQKLEQRYASLPSEALHVIREEYKWSLEECGLHFDEQLKYIEKILSMRGESLEVRVSRKILFLCKCGQSRIVTSNVPEDQVKLFIFDQYNVPCPKCKNMNQYSWKYMD